jgi:hypothetical protein
MPLSAAFRLTESPDLYPKSERRNRVHGRGRHARA